MSDIRHVTDDSFETDVLTADLPVLVDYWAEWCGPCKVIAPILEEIATEYRDKMHVCKIDIEANDETPPKYGIRGIPTLMLFKDGNVEATKVGALSKSQLTAFLDKQHLKTTPLIENPRLSRGPHRKNRLTSHPKTAIFHIRRRHNLLFRDHLKHSF